MRTFRITAAAVATATVAVLVAAPGLAARGKAVAFKASYSGTATVKQSGTSVTIAARGAGTGTPVGRSRISGKGTGNASSPPCVPFWGPGTIAAAGGATIRFTVLRTSTGCAGEQDQNQVAVSGRATVAGGTGKFAKARGTLKFAGKFDRGTGKFSITFTGRLVL